MANNGTTNHNDQPIQLSARQATVREFVAIVFRRKWIILGLFAITSLTVFAIAVSTPVEYLSFGRIYVKRGEQPSMLVPERRVFSNWEQELASELELARSHTVQVKTRQLLRERTTPGQPVPEFDPEQIDVEVLGLSNVIALGYVDRDPDVAEVVCQALLTAYLDFREANLSLTYPESFFDEEIGKVVEDLNHYGALRRQIASRTNIVDVREQTRSNLQQMTNLRSRRSETASELAEMKATLRVMEELRDQPDIDLPTIGMPYANDGILTLKRRIVEQSALVAELSERYRDESPELMKARGTLQNLEKLLAKEVDQRLELQRSRIKVLETKVASIDEEIEAMEDQLALLPEQENELARVDREQEVLKRRYEDLVEKSDIARVNKSTMAGVGVILLSPAGEAKPVNARDYVRLALAPAFALIVGIGLAFFIDGLDISIRTPSQAEEALELPVLATLSDRGKSA